MFINVVFLQDLFWGIVPHWQYFAAVISFILLSLSTQLPQDAFQSFQNSMKILKLNHGRVLAFWAAINILSGLFSFFTDGHFFYFFMMNACWGLVNSGVAAFVYYHHNNIFEKSQTILKQMDHQRHAEKVILLNIGLDLFFIACGLALYFFGKGNNIGYPELWKGFGTSVIVQGSYLLVQDTIFYRLHIINRHKVYHFWQIFTDKLWNELQ